MPPTPKGRGVCTAAGQQKGRVQGPEGVENGWLRVGGWCWSGSTAAAVASPHASG